MRPLYLHSIGPGHYTESLKPVSDMIMSEILRGPTVTEGVWGLAHLYEGILYR